MERHQAVARTYASSQAEAVALCETAHTSGAKTFGFRHKMDVYMVEASFPCGKEKCGAESARKVMGSTGTIVRCASCERNSQ